MERYAKLLKLLLEPFGMSAHHGCDNVGREMVWIRRMTHGRMIQWPNEISCYYNAVLHVEIVVASEKKPP